MKKQIATIYLSNTWLKSPLYRDLLKILTSLRLDDLKIMIINKLALNDIHNSNFEKVEDDISKARIILFPIGLYESYTTLIDFENNVAMNQSLAQLLVSNKPPIKKDREKFHSSIDILCTLDSVSIIEALYEAMDLYSENFKE
jgi:hypothetical protein